MERDRFMSATEARKFGIIDHVLSNSLSSTTSTPSTPPATDRDRAQGAHGALGDTHT